MTPFERALGEFVCFENSYMTNSEVAGARALSLLRFLFDRGELPPSHMKNAENLFNLAASKEAV